MTRGARALLTLLADGQLHSGEELATQLGVTRAAVWKQVGDLRGRGLTVESIDRRGYRLPRAVELLERARIEQAAKSANLILPKDMELLFEVNSTNDFIYAGGPSAASGARLVFAELQSAGRGRRGRSWIAPPGSGLTFSIGWGFEEMPADLSALGLAMGVRVVEVLTEAGAREAMLKWPNDIVAENRKLGGLLVQLRSEAGGPAFAVVGLGLNLSLPEKFDETVTEAGGIPATDVRTILGEEPARNELAARLAAAMIEGLGRFGREGFNAFIDQWQRFDSLLNAPVRVTQGESRIEGIARGVDRNGALQVEVDGSVTRFFSGDVSVRTTGK